MLANGGIRRTADGRRRDLALMDPSLVRLDGGSGALRDRWTLPDPRLSHRHLAWSRPADGSPPLLGVALQAGHDDPRDRAAAPVLATWDGQALSVAPQAVSVDGYAGAMLLAGARGVARWHPAQPPLMLAWPSPMVLDNHGVVVPA